MLPVAAAMSQLASQVWPPQESSCIAPLHEEGMTQVIQVVIESMPIDIIFSICALLWLLRSLSRQHRTCDTTPDQHADKQGREFADMGVLVSQWKQTLEKTCDRKDVARSMPKQGLARRDSKGIEKAQLTNIVNMYAKNRELEEFAQIFGEIEMRFQSVLDVMDYHCVIVQLARGGLPDTAHKWLRRSMEVGLQPLAGAFNSVILSYGKKQEIAQAMGLVDEMQAAGVSTNTVTHNAIMDAWARVGDVGKAQMWMRKMLDQGIQPNVVSFGIILSACANSGLLKELDHWFELSQDLGFELNVITFDSVVRAFARSDDADNAMKWMGIMIENGVGPEISCCMQVLTAIFKKDDLPLVDTLIGHMRAVGVQPDGVFFSRCVTLAAKAGHSIKAQGWADECAEADCRLTWAARQAMIDAGLILPKLSKGGQDVAADGKAGVTISVVGAPKYTGIEKTEAQQKSIKEIQEERCAAVGKRFSGTVKDFVPGQFGYIRCAAIRELFQSDVFLGRYDNPELFMKGQRVSFTLRVDEAYGLPRASEVSAVRLCK